MESEIITDVVMRLVGSVRPIADSRIDSERSENMNNLMKVVSELLEAIEDVAKIQETCYGSVEDARNQARSFLKNVKDDIEDALYE